MKTQDPLEKTNVLIMTTTIEFTIYPTDLYRLITDDFGKISLLVRRLAGVGILGFAIERWSVNGFNWGPVLLIYFGLHLAMPLAEMILFYYFLSIITGRRISISISIEESGLTIIRKRTSQEVLWSSIKTMKETRSFFSFSGNQSRVFIPKRAFDSVDSIYSFRTFASEKLGIQLSKTDPTKV